MKHFLLLLQLCFVSLAVSASMTLDVTISFSLEEFNFVKNPEGILSISTARGIRTYPEGNEPGLPIIVRNIALPAGATVQSISVNTSKKLIESGVDVARGPVVAPPEGCTVSVPEYEGKYPNTTYPAETCKHVMTSPWKDLTVAHCLVTPFYYETNEMNLYFIDSLTLSIEYELSDAVEQNLRPAPQFVVRSTVNKLERDSSLPMNIGVGGGVGVMSTPASAPKRMITVSDIHGNIKTRMCLESAATSVDVNMSGYAPGMYIVSLYDNGSLCDTYNVIKK